MTNKDIFDDAFPQNKQIGGSHYKKFNSFFDINSNG